MRMWLRMHAHALADSLRRLFAQPLGSAFSILVLAVAISLPVLAAVALRSVGMVTAGLETDPHMNVYLALDASDEDARRVGEALRAHREAAAVRFVSRTQALEELKSTTHLAELLGSLDRNPLPHAFTVRVRTAERDRLAAARSEWSQIPKVEQVVADFEWSERLAQWVRFGNHLVAMVALFLGGAVAFIVGHLIRLQVVSRRQEIEVSRLVGATASDVRRPLLYQGVLEGGLAGAVAVALSWAVALWIGVELRALTPTYSSEIKVVFLSLPEVIAVVVGAAALGLVGAWWAVGRELRLFAPGR
jgi:cell division transport system permease protein